MDTWNRLADAQGEEDGGDWIEKVKGLEHTGIIHGFRQQFGEGQEMGRQGWAEVDEGGKKGDTCNNVKKKKKSPL